MKINFFPRVGKNFWGDRSHTLDDSFFKEMILIKNFIIPLSSK